ncbi:MAG: hypothetical protein VYE73_17225, partial [Acidobacteriota bacterium]|nr:hypothetical protein [Acidobacteriota bacterium]
MNRDDPSLARVLNLSERYDLGGDLLVLVEGPEQLMDEAASGPLDILRGLPSVRIAGHAIPRNWMADHSPWLVERALFDSWLAAVRDPTRIDDLRAEFEALLKALGSVARHLGLSGGFGLLFCLVLMLVLLPTSWAMFGSGPDAGPPPLPTARGPGVRAVRQLARWAVRRPWLCLS